MNQSNYYINKRYKVLHTLGDGTYSSVCKAKDTKTGKFVALKIINKYHINSQIMAQTNQEFNILRALQHPDIVKCIDKFEDQHNIYLALEYIEGTELFQKICQKRAYNEIESRKIIRSILHSVNYLHNRSIVHRDLKPENLILSNESGAEESKVKVIDFGLSASGVDNDSLTMFCGTPEYMAPEIIQHLPYGKSVDMWSLGIILYCLLSGSLPFSGRDPEEIFEHVLHSPVLYPKSTWGHISNDGMSFVKGLLTKDPKKRLTVHQALQHSWLQTSDAQVTEKRNQTQERLTAGVHRKRFRKVVNVLSCARYLGKAKNIPETNQTGNIVNPATLITAPVQSTNSNNLFAAPNHLFLLLSLLCSIIYKSLLRRNKSVM